MNNFIYVQGIDVGLAIYESNWYEYGDDAKKMLVIVLLRSERLLALHIGPMYNMSIEVLMKVRLDPCLET